MAGHFVRRLGVGLCGLLGALALTAGAGAHEGHDHGAPVAAPPATLAPRAEAASADFELVAVLRDGRLHIHLDRFADNAPVEGATVEVDASGVSQAATPVEPGTYVVPAPFAARPGPHDLAFTVTAGDTVDVLAATLVVPAPPAAERAPAPAALAQLGASQAGVLAGVAIGFVAGVLLMALRRRAPAVLLFAGLGLASVAAASDTQAAEAANANTNTAEAAGTAEAAKPAARDAAQRLPDGSVIVPKPSQRILGVRTLITASGAFAPSVALPARVVPDPNASGLVQSAVGGRIAPPEGGFRPLGTRVAAGDILAYVLPPIGASDLKDLEQQGFELDQQIAIVKRRYERLSAIPNAVTRREVEEAEIELNGLKTRRATLERVQREPEALRAPVAGVLASADAAAGQMADPNTVLFRIVDPDRLWVEALSFSPEAGRTGAEGRLSDGRAVGLAFLGAGLTDRNQAVPVQFAVTGGGAGLRAGQLLTVLAASGTPRPGIALPRAAVVRGANGQTIVYEHASAERFVPREVKAEPLDAGRVLVVAGLLPGRRVVAQGAELIDQIR